MDFLLTASVLIVAIEGAALLAFILWALLWCRNEIIQEQVERMAEGLFPETEGNPAVAATGYSGPPFCPGRGGRDTFMPHLKNDLTCVVCGQHRADHRKGPPYGME